MRSLDGSLRVDARAVNKLMTLAAHWVQAREQFRAVHERTLGQAAGEPEPSPAPTTLVLFGTPDDGRMATPLAQVERIVEVAEDAAWSEEGFRLVSVDGVSLPLLELGRALPERRSRPRRAAEPGGPPGRLQLLVHRTARGRLAFVVDQLLDVLEDALLLPQPATRTGARAAVVLRGRVTELLDAEELAARVPQVFFERQEAAQPSASQGGAAGR